MDRRALLFSLAVAVASALVFGLVPAIQASRTDSDGHHRRAATRSAAGGAAAGDAPFWSTAQVAASVVLLVVAMFMYRGFGQQLANGPGYRIDHLLMMGFDTEPDPLQRRAGAAVLPAGRGTGTGGAGRQRP